MLIDIIVGIALAAVILLLLWALRGVMLLPVSCGGNTKMRIELAVSGEEPELQHTLEGLIWLRDNGTLKADVDVIISGIDNDTRHVAQSYAADNKFISVIER